MLEDDKVATPTQQTQIAAGQYAALSAAVHALIASHPDRLAFARALDEYAGITDRIFLTPTALQADDGMRQAYSEVMRSLRGAANAR
jgi:hypothetical protein